MIGARSSSAASDLASLLGSGSRYGSLRQAVEFADVILVAIRPTGVLAALLDAGGASGSFAGKVVIDCNNPVETSGFTLTTNGNVSLAEQIAVVAPGSLVVKAFNQCHADVWSMRPPIFDGRALAVPICGDDTTAKSTVATLLEAMGCAPVDIGALHRARHLEAMAAIVISLLFSGSDPTTVFNLVDANRH